MLDQPRLAPPIYDPPAKDPGLVGFLGAMRRNALLLWGERAYRERFVVNAVLNRRQVLINDPDAIAHVLIKNAANYLRPPITRILLQPLLGDGLLLSEGAAWRFQRRTIAPIMTPRSMPVLCRHVATVADATVARLSAQQDVKLLAAMQTTALEIAGQSMFSLDMEQFGDELRGLLFRFVRDLSSPSIVDLLLPDVVPSPKRPARRAFRRDWLDLIGRIVDARAAQPPAGGPRDLFDMLIAARDPETGAGFGREQLCDEVATMILAGHETTALTLYWSMTLLAQSPAWQARVAAEGAAHPFGPEDAADILPKLHVTRAVVSEALRLYPPAFMFTRRAIAADDAAGIPIPAKAVVTVAPWVLHRHHALWTDPAAFDPARFLPDAPPPPRFAYLPFGAGHRVCVGAQFALAEAVLVLAKLMAASQVSSQDAAEVRPWGRVTTGPDRIATFAFTPRPAAPPPRPAARSGNT